MPAPRRRLHHIHYLTRSQPSRSQRIHNPLSVAYSGQIRIYVVEALLVVIYLPKKKGRLYVHSTYLDAVETMANPASYDVYSCSFLPA
jgi:hypothetical protein